MYDLAGRLGREVKRASAEVWSRRPLSVSDSRPTVDLVLSLTTFPERLSSAAITLKTLLRQTVRPRALVVVLSKVQFDRVPEELKRFEHLGVRVIFDDGDIRSFKKLIPIREQFSGATIVTADDDVIYPSDWLARLVSAHQRGPNDVVGHRGTCIVGGKESLAPYVSWPQAGVSTPSARVFLTGMGGILYPADALPPEALDRSLAIRLCPTADDIWFKAMELIGGVSVRKVSDDPAQLHGVRSAQRFSLRQLNVDDGRNDAQFRTVMDYFGLWEKLGSE